MIDICMVTKRMPKDKNRLMKKWREIVTELFSNKIKHRIKQ